MKIKEIGYNKIYLDMKKLMFNKIAIIMAVAISLIACKDDFLSEVNPNEISTENFWKNTTDLNTGLIAVYNAFKDGNVMSTGNEYNRSDMSFPGWGRPNTSNEYWLQTFNDASGAPNSKWQAIYKGIFRANQVIAACENLMPILNEENKIEATLVLAQARAMRGMFYFFLHNSFNQGAVPIYDFVPADESEFYQPISSAETVRTFFTADLEFGMDNLPKSYNANNLGRITAGACSALLGQSYLYANEYDKAAEYFKDVIDNYGYQLTASIGSNFTTKDELNIESILEINYSLSFKSEIDVYSSENVSSTNNFAFSPVGGWRSIYPSCWLIMEYKKEQLDFADPRNLVTDATGTHLRKYSLRTSYSIALVDDPDLPYYGLTTAQATAFNNKETGYWRKYTNWDITDNEKNISQATPRSGVNVRVIRLADVYLMYAESLIKGGTDDSKIDEALMYVNKVRRRSAVKLLGLSGSGEYPFNDHDNITYNAQSLMNHLMYVERPLELSAEGHAIRTIDLRRWGITQQRFQELSLKQYYVNDYKYIDADGKDGTRWGSILMDDGAKPAVEAFNEFTQSAQNYIETEHAYWPIPNSEITANPKLYNQ